jgi:hypothetical protein
MQSALTLTGLPKDRFEQPLGFLRFRNDTGVRVLEVDVHVESCTRTLHPLPSSAVSAQHSWNPSVTRRRSGEFSRTTKAAQKYLSIG